jgi:transcriptional regulator with XRE-family HTH domain
MDVGARIREARREAGLTQQMLADRCGCTSRAVQNWERGDAQPRLESLVDLARALDWPLASFISFLENGERVS